MSGEHSNVKWPIDRFWLCVPAVLMYISDVTTTLLSQRPAFWSGAFHMVEEGNPVARLILLQGPLAFVAATCLWAVGFCTLICFGNRSWALVLSFALTVSHALGTAHWLPRHGWLGIVGAVLVLIVAERVLTRSWDQAKRNIASPDEL